MIRLPAPVPGSWSGRRWCYRCLRCRSECRYTPLGTADGAGWRSAREHRPPPGCHSCRRAVLITIPSSVLPEMTLPAPEVAHRRSCSPVAQRPARRRLGSGDRRRARTVGADQVPRDQVPGRAGAGQVNARRMLPEITLRAPLVARRSCCRPITIDAVDLVGEARRAGSVGADRIALRPGCRSSSDDRFRRRCNLPRSRCPRLWRCRRSCCRLSPPERRRHRRRWERGRTGHVGADQVPLDEIVVRSRRTSPRRKRRCPRSRCPRRAGAADQVVRAVSTTTPITVTRGRARSCRSRRCRRSSPATVASLPTVPSTTLAWPLPLMTLPAPAAVPPIVSPEVARTIPSLALPRAAVPAALVPTKLPATEIVAAPRCTSIARRVARDHVARAGARRGRAADRVARRAATDARRPQRRWEWRRCR